MTVIYQLPLQVLLRGSHFPNTTPFSGVHLTFTTLPDFDTAGYLPVTASGLLRGSHLPITAAFTGGSTYQTALDTAYDRLLPKCKHLDLRYGVSHTSSETSKG